MLTWSIETRQIKDLKDHPRNPRKLSKEDAEGLKESIQKFGIIDKPIITKEGLIIGGHQRKRILKEIGLKEVECWIPSRDLTDKEIDELNIRLNRNTGEWDWDKLANEWEVTDLLDWGFNLADFDMDAEQVESETEEDDEGIEPAKDEDAFTKLGDVYELFTSDSSVPHRICCGDSTIPETVASCLGGNEPVLVATDPPYNIAGECDVVAKDCSKSMKSLSESNWDKGFEVKQFLKTLDAFEECSIYIFTSHFLASDIWEWMRGWSSHYSWCVWSKPNPMPSLMKRHWTWNSELVCYATKGKHVFNFPEEGHALSTWQINKENPTESHPTQKPVSVMAHIIKHSSRKADAVYDPFLGSGTTLIACEQLGRVCYGIELSPAYVDVIIGRWMNHMRKHNKEFKIKHNGVEIQWGENAKT